MNIFALHIDPIQSAKWLCDKHLSKMLLESCQMIANCFSPDVLQNAPKTQKGNVRKYSYFNHPCSIWTRETRQNLSWVINHSIEIENQRIDRGMNPHFSFKFIEWAYFNKEHSNNPVGELTQFKIAISNDKKCRGIAGFGEFSPVLQYRLYYKLDKPFAKWKKNKPSWMEYSNIDIIQDYTKNLLT